MLHQNESAMTLKGNVVNRWVSLLEKGYEYIWH